MRLVHIKDSGNTLSMELFPDKDVPRYAILSHTWGAQEITFDDMRRGVNLDSEGYRKIQQCCKTAALSYEYAWVDTCCIDKTSSAELSEAINSMYRWYEEADVCYAYLADVPVVEFAESRWFTRGWTLQELIAPREVIFFDREWNILGTRDSLQNEISERTNIPLSILNGSKSLDMMSVAQRMSWASQRQTTRIEDEAYCLMGIFGINMPLLYGEGDKAFIRLQEEIMNVSDDHTIFAWKDDSDSGSDGGLLASSAAAFSESHDIIVKSGPSFSTKVPWRLDNKGLHLQLYTMAVGADGLVLAILPCTEVGMEDDWMAVYLRDTTLTMENFERVCKSELVPVDLKLFRPAQYPSRALCVQRQRLATIRRKNPTKRDMQEKPPPITKLNLFMSSGDDGQAQEPSSFSKNSLTDLCEAAREGNLQRTWRLLSRPRQRADMPDSHGRTPLSHAAERGHIDVVWLLLTRSDVDPFSVDNNGTSPVLYAAQHDHNKVVEVFLARKSGQNDIQDNYGRTILSYAAEGGSEAVVKMLASRSDFDPDLEDSEYQTPLSWAARGGHEKIVQILADHGADINAADANERLPIWHAVANGHVGTMHKLIDLGSVTQHCPFSLPVNEAPREEIICTLSDHDATFDPIDVSGNGVLIWAATNYHHALFDMLLKRVANVDQADHHGRSILSESLENEATDTFDRIVAHGLDLDAECMWRPGPADSDTVIRETPLAWAARTKRYEVFRKLVTLGVNINPPPNFLEDITCPLDWALKEGDKSLFVLLLEHGADIYARDKYGCMLFHWVCLEDDMEEFVKIFLHHGADPNVTDKEDGSSPLFSAAYARNVKVVRLLLDHGADPDTKNRDPEPLIYYAAKQEHHDMATLLIERGANVNAINRRGETALAAAVENSDMKMARLLLEHGANPNTTDRDGTSPFIDAVRNNRQLLINLLLEHGADAKARDGYGTPVLLDAMGWSVELGKLLIKHGADPHAKDRNGISAASLRKK